MNDDCTSCRRSLDEQPAKTCYHKGRHVCGKRHGGAMERCELPREECRQQQERQRQEQWIENPSAVALRSEDIIHGLDRFHRHPNPKYKQWAKFEEFRIGVGFWSDVENARSQRAQHTLGPLVWERRIDFFAINLWPSKGSHLVAYEVKVSKADFNSELRNPEKRSDALAISTEFYFATPQGLIDPVNIPPECGLREIRYGPRGGIYVDTIVEAPERELGPLHWRTFASACARVHERRL